MFIFCAFLRSHVWVNAQVPHDCLADFNLETLTCWTAVFKPTSSGILLRPTRYKSKNQKPNITIFDGWTIPFWIFYTHLFSPIEALPSASTLAKWPPMMPPCHWHVPWSKDREIHAPKGQRKNRENHDLQVMFDHVWSLVWTRVVTIGILSNHHGYPWDTYRIDNIFMLNQYVFFDDHVCIDFDGHQKISKRWQNNHTQRMGAASHIFSAGSSKSRSLRGSFSSAPVWWVCVRLRCRIRLTGSFNQIAGFVQKCWQKSILIYIDFIEFPIKLACLAGAYPVSGQTRESNAPKTQTRLAHIVPAEYMVYWKFQDLILLGPSLIFWPTACDCVILVVFLVGKSKVCSDSKIFGPLGPHVQASDQNLLFSYIWQRQKMD